MGPGGICVCVFVYVGVNVRLCACICVHVPRLCLMLKNCFGRLYYFRLDQLKFYTFLLCFWHTPCKALNSVPYMRTHSRTNKLRVHDVASLLK